MVSLVQNSQSFPFTARERLACTTTYSSPKVKKQLTVAKQLVSLFEHKEFHSGIVGPTLRANASLLNSPGVSASWAF